MSTAHTLPDVRVLAGSEWTAGAGPTFQHLNPSTGKVNQEFALGDASDVDRAVHAARHAFRDWRRVPPNERRDLLLRVASLLLERADEFASLVTSESGIPAGFAPMVGGLLPAEFFSYNAGWADKLGGETIPVWPGDVLDYTITEPHGVVGVIIPWNGPMTSIGQKVAPALAAGNCIVIKPPELAPFSSVRFAELCLEAGIPPGVVNVVPGTGEAGNALVRHPDVNLISFTGGIPTAKLIQAAAAENLTPLVLELGGKSANLVFADADIDGAVAAAVQYGVAAMSGQGCILPTRLLVEAAAYDDVVDQVVDLVGTLTVGLPESDDTLMGPLISAAHCDRVMGFIDRAREQGTQLLSGGHRVGGDLADGYFVEPTVFGNVDNNTELAQEEIFGPVLSIIKFDTEAEAVALANDTRYGLAGYVWTQDVSRAHRVVRELDAGFLSINGFALVPPSAPFGGMKASGYGREGGRAGVEEFLRTKNVYLDLRT